VVLKWFYSLSRRKTFVGGKCVLPSALLVRKCNKGPVFETVYFIRQSLAVHDPRVDQKAHAVGMCYDTIRTTVF